VETVMKKYCLIGENIAHSYSPVIHRALLGAYGAEGTYELLDIPAKEFSKTFKTLAGRFDGCNVTKPYKESVLPYLDGLSGAASACRSVNTVVFEGGKAVGYSTDGAGFLRALGQEGFDPAGKRVLILGGGGAAKAVAHALGPYAAEISFLDVRKDDVGAARRCRPETNAQTQRGSHGVRPLPVIIVNCTPVGQYPDIQASPLSPEQLDGAAFVFDTVYNPRETRLLSQARARGIKCAGGLGMLIFQAYEAERIWQGRDLTEKQLCDTMKQIERTL
jgi:shikimate dehydrogenase